MASDGSGLVSGRKRESKVCEPKEIVAVPKCVYSGEQVLQDTPVMVVVVVLFAGDMLNC